jgi:hypothetical protein
MWCAGYFQCIQFIVPLWITIYISNRIAVAVY